MITSKSIVNWDDALKFLLVMSSFNITTQTVKEIEKFCRLPDDVSGWTFLEASKYVENSFYSKKKIEKKNLLSFSMSNKQYSTPRNSRYNRENLPQFLEVKSNEWSNTDLTHLIDDPMNTIPCE